MGRLVIAMWAAAAAWAADPPTFNKDVLPILQKNWQSCHRPASVGAPESFTAGRCEGT